jgi:hypothetical protein
MFSKFTSSLNVDTACSSETSVQIYRAFGALFAERLGELLVTSCLHSSVSPIPVCEAC